MKYFTTSSMNDILEQLSKIAEAEIVKRLSEVAEKAIEASKEQIVAEVKLKHSLEVSTQLVQLMNSTGFEVQYSFRPKGCK